MSDDHASNVKIVIDLSYEELMTDKVLALISSTYHTNFRILRCC